MSSFAWRHDEPWRSLLEHWIWTVAVSVVLPLGGAGIAIVVNHFQLKPDAVVHLLLWIAMPVIVAASFVGWCIRLIAGQDSMDQWSSEPALALIFVFALPVTLTCLVDLPMWIWAFMCRKQLSRRRRNASNEGVVTVDRERSRLIPALNALGMSCAVAVGAAGAFAVGYVNWGLDAQRGNFDHESAALTFPAILVYSLAPFALTALRYHIVRRT